MKLLNWLIIVICIVSCVQKKDKKLDRYPNDWFYTQRAYPKFDIPSELVLKSIEDHQEYSSEKNLLIGYDEPWVSVGPSNIGGRITDVEMFSDDQQIILAGSASGGIFRSPDQGETWESIFDNSLSLSIGDIAIAPSNESVIYVGTGEANAGGGSLAYDGLGVYRSNDKGETWEYANLAEAGSIGKVLVDPNDDKTVFVASMGRLFGNNQERGVYKTTNGGVTWNNVLNVSDSTGAIDLAINPIDGNIIYAAMWERIRRPNYRQYGGITSDIYKSIDGGVHWVKLTNGLPTAPADKGRIGLSISATNPDVLYALVTDQIGYIEGIYKTTDAGASWKKKSISGIENVSYNWWFGKIWVDPADEERLFVAALDMYESKNGAESWSLRFNGAHVDQHALIMHPQNPELVVAGNDGGIYTSNNGGDTYLKSPNLPNLQYYTCEIDQSNPERLYGGTQDNGTNRTLTGQEDDWSQIFGGDGFRVIVDPNNSNNIYAEYQRGGIVRSTNGGQSFLNGRSGLSGTFNWNTPITIDQTSTNRLYTGAQRIFRSNNRAANWTAISPDLTNGPYNGNLNFGTITAIEVSDINNQIIYAGTDDGNIWVTKNGGTDWNMISQNLPVRWVTSIETDPFDVNRVFVTLSGYRYDQGDGQVFVSYDQGLNWTNLASNLPNMPINKIIADPTTEGTLFIATDLGVYFSTDAGDTWNILGTELPIVPVLDLDIHSETNFLLAATFGRSMYKYNLPQSTANENTFIAEKIKITPNPVVDYLNIESNQRFDKIQIFNIEGEIVHSMSQLKYKIDISFLTTGVYILKVRSKEKYLSQKFIKI